MAALPTSWTRPATKSASGAVSASSNGDLEGAMRRGDGVAPESVGHFGQGGSVDGVQVSYGHGLNGVGDLAHA